MEMISEQINGIVVLQLSGRFEAYTAPPVEEFFQKLSTTPLPWAIVDLSQVNFIDSTGLSTLVIGMKYCQQQQGDLVLCGIQQATRVIFEATRLDTVFTIASTQEEAIAIVQIRQKS
jgi:anti-sigma B factor antagonist